MVTSSTVGATSVPTDSPLVIDGLCLDAIREPEAVDQPALRAHLREFARRPDRHGSALLSLIATILYLDPTGADDEVVSALVTAVTAPGLPTETYRAAGAVVRALDAAPIRSRMLTSVLTLLRRSDVDPRLHEVLVPAVEDLVAAEPGTVAIDDVLSLAEVPHLSRYRGRLGRLAGSCAVDGEGAISRLDVDRLASLDDASGRYALYAAAHSPTIDPDVRSTLTRYITSHFPLHDIVREILQAAPRRVVVIQNIADAQGDEIIRVVQLVQALLDSSPDLTVTLLTDRAYLYAHPRLQLIDIHDSVAANALLEECNAIVNFVEHHSVRSNHNLKLESLIHKRQLPLPRLCIQARKGYNEFIYGAVVIDGREMVGALRLDRQHVNCVYDPTTRLITELGLPLRRGRSEPVSGPILAGLDDPGASRAWDELTQSNEDRCPVALINPFGGATELKGYTPDLQSHLVALMRRVLADGYFLVILPTDREWGSARCVREAVAFLRPEERSRVAVAREPDPSGEAVTYDSPNRITVPARSYAMHQFVHFARRADLILAVEGWMVHAAYALGKVYRVLMLPYSHGRAWRPYLCARGQDIMAAPFVPATPLTGSSNPVLDYTRKRLLIALLQLIRGRSEPALAAILTALAASPDRDLRQLAAEELGRSVHPTAPAVLRGLLGDGYYRVRGAAAEALLDRGWARPCETGELRAHTEIARNNRDWGTVVRMGAAAALHAASDDEDPVVRGEARALATQSEMDSRTREKPTAQAADGSFRRTVVRQRILSRLRPGENETRPKQPRIAILTPVKDAKYDLDEYFANLERLTYPPHLLSVGFLESDSRDGTRDAISLRMPELRRRFRRVGLWKRDFGYRVPSGVHRGAGPIQLERRVVLAKSRNYLLFRMLDDEDWVLWLDVDVTEYPPDIIESLLATGRDIVQPHCVLDPGGPTFDRNAWRDRGRYCLDDFRGGDDVVELDAVGGTMLLVRADIHREGLIFPTFRYGLASPYAREGQGEVETEGLGLVAREMGYSCWGMPNLEIIHRRT